MKNLAHLTIFAVLLTGLISPVEAIGQDKSCQFEATGTDDVYLVIREKAGPGETREIVVWEGWVKKDQKKRYASQTGQVRYDYTDCLPMIVHTVTITAHVRMAKPSASPESG